MQPLFSSNCSTKQCKRSKTSTTREPTSLHQVVHKLFTSVSKTISQSTDRCLRRPPSCESADARYVPCQRLQQQRKGLNAQSSQQNWSMNSKMSAFSLGLAKTKLITSVLCVAPQLQPNQVSRRGAWIREWVLSLQDWLRQSSSPVSCVLRHNYNPSLWLASLYPVMLNMERH